MSPIKRDAVRVLYMRDENDDFGYWGSSSWVWGRWILFVIFVVFILAIGVCTARVNRRRRTLGQAPIRGTAWMTPPSYRQSQRQYNGSAGRVVEDFVPQYTETANEQDLGYYDEHGEFHLNSKAEYLPPPTLIRETRSDSSESLERPRAAVTRDPPSSDLDLDLDMNRDFRRYTHRSITDTPDPVRTSITSANNQNESLASTTAGNEESIVMQNISSPERVRHSKK